MPFRLPGRWILTDPLNPSVVILDSMGVATTCLLVGVYAEAIMLCSRFVVLFVYSEIIHRGQAGRMASINLSQVVNYNHNGAVKERRTDLRVFESGVPDRGVPAVPRVAFHLQIEWQIQSR